MQKKRLTLTERLADFIVNALKEDIKDGKTEAETSSFKLGVAGSNLILFHNTNEDKKQAAERKQLYKYLIKLGLGYCATIGKVNRECKITIVEVNCKNGKDVLQVNLDYYIGKLKRKNLRPEGFVFRKRKNVNTKS